jgi:hypothetical protein
MSSTAEQLADDYARGEIDEVPKCGQGKRTKAEQVFRGELKFQFLRLGSNAI